MRRENQLRFDYHLSLLPKDQREILEILPVLFHFKGDCFFPALKSDSLFGIEGYVPRPEHLLRVGSYFHSFKNAPVDSASLFEKKKSFEFLYLMGSAGTIAYTPGSDMDFWIGIEKRKTKPAQLEILKTKISWIEKWAETSHNMEIHFFLTDIADLRLENYGELGGESCGSTLGKLLKDEFYRSMIHLAGKYPKFWAISSETDEKEYDAIRFERGQSDKSLRILDIGHAQSFETKEIFGAALWQILKGLHSPFKSVIKIALLEYYASRDHIDLLCNQLKSKILTSGQAERIDPYFEMILLVRDYKHNHAMAPEDAALLEECFLIKCLFGIDQNTQRAKYQNLLHIAEDWGISQETFQHLLGFEDWRYEEKSLLAEKIFSYFVNTYMRLREKAMKQAGSISERDLTVMGKTLRAFLTKAPNKVPFHFSLLEARSIYLVRLTKDRDVENRETWVLQADFHGKQSGNKNIRLFQHFDLLPVCAWLVVNQHYHSSQKISLLSTTTFSLNYITDFLRQFQDFMPDSSIIDHVLENWQDAASYIKLFIMPNSHESENHDRLEHITCFSVNSFGEVYYHFFQGSNALEQFVSTMILKGINWKHIQGDMVTIFRTGGPLLGRNRVSNSIQTKLESLLEKLQEKAGIAQGQETYGL